MTDDEAYAEAMHKYEETIAQCQNLAQVQVNELVTIRALLARLVTLAEAAVTDES